MNTHHFYSKNFPSNIDEKFKEDFEAEIKKKFFSLEVLKDSDLNSIFLGVLYEVDIQNAIQSTPDFSYPIGGSKALKLYFFDEPDLSSKGPNTQQSAKNEVFQLILKASLENAIEKLSKKVEIPISILCIYNNKDAKNYFEDLAFQALKKKNNVKGEKAPISFIPVKPTYKFERVILNESLQKEIDKTLVLIKKSNIIYDLFGFNEVEPKPKIILNFHGESGTGKTITAHAIAHDLGKMILALNYAEIESKYVGEAPKNLVSAFECARKNDAILFFDESDSFLGKRIRNVSSSSDQAVNSLRSQMLILLEQHEGIVIFATNLAENYDKAFESRILKHLKFELPDEKQRKSLIQLMLPKKLPYHNNKAFTDNELDILVQVSEGFSGRLIKNAVLEGLTNAVMDDREYVVFPDFDLSFNGLKKSLSDLNGKESSSAITFSDENIKTIESVVSDELSKMEEQEG